MTTTLRRHLSPLFRGADARTDGELIEAFTAGDEGAFARLVERHGSMVLGVCRRVLGNAHDADDAFQATWIALSRQARGTAWRDSLAGWLHDVAWRAAVKLRGRAARRLAVERQAVPTAPPAPAGELQTALDEEVRRLPADCREALLRCYFQGQTRQQAAGQLGWSLRTLERRLDQGRQRLRERLEARGATLAVLLALTPVVVSPALAASAVGRVATPAVAALAGELVGRWSAGWLAGGVVLLAAGIAAAALSRAAPPPAPPAGRPAAAPVEEPLPVGALARLGTTRLRHGYMVNAVAFAPDGRTIASAGNGRGLCVWDARTRRLRYQRSWARIPAVYGVAFSPDGRHIVTADGSSPRLWEAATGKHLREFKGHTSGVVSAAFSPKGDRIASGSHDATVRLWDPATGRQVLELTGHKQAAWGLAFSPRGDLLATGGLDGTVRVWSTLTGRQRVCFTSPGDSITSVSFHKDGQRIASVGSKHVHVWSLQTEKLLHAIRTDAAGIQTVAFSPDGSRLAVGCNDRTVRMHDADTGRELRRWSAHAFRVCGMAWSPDGKTLATTAPWDSAVRLWDADRGQEIAPTGGHTGPVDRLLFPVGGDQLLSYGRDQRLVRWDLAAGKSTIVLDRISEVALDAAAISPDGQLFARGSRGKTDGGVRLYSAATGRLIRPLGKNADRVYGVAFTPDGKRLASLAADRVLRLCDVTSGALVWESRDLPESLSLVAITHPMVFSPDGKQLVVSTGSAGVCLLDAATGKQLRRHRFEQDGGAVAFSPDGKLVALSGGFRSAAVTLWNPHTGAVVRSWDTPHTGVYGVAFSPDGRLLATSGDEGDSTVRVWELATQRLVAVFRGHHSAVLPVAFSPDGRTLASGGGDAAVLLWDVTGRRRGGRLPAVRLSAARSAALWEKLADEDAAAAHAAVWELVAGAAVPFLRGRLAAADVVGSNEVGRLVRQLDADDFATRQAATQGLLKLGWGAEPHLRRTLQGGLTLEPRRRVEAVLARLERSEEWLRYRRALAVLEHIGTVAARRAVEALAAGPAETRPTEEAKAVLARMR